MRFDALALQIFQKKEELFFYEILSPGPQGPWPDTIAQNKQVLTIVRYDVGRDRVILKMAKFVHFFPVNNLRTFVHFFPVEFGENFPWIKVIWKVSKDRYL